MSVQPKRKNICKTKDNKMNKFLSYIKQHIDNLNRKRLVLSLVLFICLLVLNIYCSSKIIISFGTFNETPFEYQIFYTSSWDDHFSGEKSVRQLSEKGYHIHRFELPTYRLKRLRIDFGNNPGKVNISHININGSKSKTLGDFSKFVPLYISEFKNNGVNLEITSHENDPQIVYKEPLNIHSKLHISNLWLILSLIGCCIFYCLNRHKILLYLFLYTPFILLSMMHYKSLFAKVSAKYCGNVSWRFVCDFISANSFIFIILAALLGLFFLWRKSRIPAITVILFLSLILSIDYIVIDNLDARFIFSEVMTQGKEFDTAWEMMKKYLTTELGWLNLLFITNFIFIFAYFRHTSKKIALSFLVIIGLSYINMHIAWDKGIFNYMYYNVFDVNFKNHQAVKHSEEAIKNLQSTVDTSIECVNGLNTRKNVILIIAESLSSYKIKSFNGLEDKMPKLDAIARHGVSYKNFYSNSYNTLGGIFSILTGKTMIQDYFGLGNYHYASYYKETLPKRLEKTGYFTEFFTGIDLAYGMDVLLKYSGFTKLSISDDPFYNGKERIIFNSVADNVLFDNVLAHIEKEKKNRPFLYVVSTISTHGPYIDPLTKERSFDKTLAFLDNELDRFINNLKQTDFFNNGMVIITGDHRAMLPVSNEEYKHYGVLGDSAIPLIIIDYAVENENKEEYNTYSQTDIAPSLEYYLTEKGCFNKFQRNLFDSNYHANVCLIHSYLSPKDKVGVYCSEEKHADIYLNGDKTTISDETLSSYKDYVLYLRTLPMYKEPSNQNK